MQGTLLHYDRILSQAQPAYVSHLRLNLFAAKSGTDKSILGLSIVSIGVIPMQVLCGLSTLLHLPLRWLLLLCSGSLYVRSADQPSPSSLPSSTGIFSQNVEVPYQADTEAPVNVAWGVIFIGLLVVAFGVFGVVRYFKWSAHRKWKLRRPD
jgi:hypothetical protein